MRSTKLVIFLAIASALMSSSVMATPSTQEFRNLLSTCAAGSKEEFSADLIGNIGNIYEGNKDLIQGTARNDIQAYFLEQLPDKDRLEGYRLYVECVKSILQDDSSSLRLGPIRWGGEITLIVSPSTIHRFLSKRGLGFWDKSPYLNFGTDGFPTVGTDPDLARIIDGLKINLYCLNKKQVEAYKPEIHISIPNAILHANAALYLEEDVSKVKASPFRFSTMGNGQQTVMIILESQPPNGWSSDEVFSLFVSANSVSDFLGGKCYIDLVKFDGAMFDATIEQVWFGRFLLRLSDRLAMRPSSNQLTRYLSTGGTVRFGFEIPSDVARLIQ